MSDINQQSKEWASVFDSISGWSAVVLVASASFSRSLFLLAGLVFSLSWFGSRQARQGWRDLKDVPITAPMLLLFTIIGTWALWSPAPSGDVFNNIKVYCKLILVLQLIVTLKEPIWQKRAWVGFSAGMLLVVVSTWLNVIVDLPWSQTKAQGIGADHSVFVEYVSQSVMSALFLGACLHWAHESQKPFIRAAWLFAGAVTLLSVMLLLQGRSGWIACAVVLISAVFFYIPAKQRPWVLGAMLAGVSLISTFSPLIRLRVSAAYDQLVNYVPMTLSSLGSRIDMWLLALKTFTEHPWLGAGAGMYHSLAAAHFGHCEMTCTHPHNQYLFFAMEYGVLGLLAFIWLLWRIGKTAWISTRPERVMLLFWLMIVAIDSIYNVPLWYRAQSYFFYAMLGLCVASCLPINQRFRN